jgi:AraC-like DNA-binding protein
MARLNRLLAEEQLYLDPGLTLARLAKRLHVPAKRLSAAINQAAGENVSRFINGFRIRRACERLEAGDNVTTAMLESGFNAKSNFNREFLRVTGSTPSAWLSKNVEPKTTL